MSRRMGGKGLAQLNRQLSFVAVVPYSTCCSSSIFLSMPSYTFRNIALDRDEWVASVSSATLLPPSSTQTAVLFSTMPTPQLPLDIYHLLLPFLPSLSTHLALSQTSPALRQHLYPSDHTSWLRILNDFGYSYECVRGEGKEARTAREVVVEIVSRQGREKRGKGRGDGGRGCGWCKGRMVIGIGAGSEGVLGEVSYGGVCEKAKKWNGAFDSSAHRQVLSAASFAAFYIISVNTPSDLLPYLSLSLYGPSR
jgi:hypothetical protein